MLLTVQAEICDSDCVKKWRIVRESDFDDLEKAHLSMVCAAEVLWYDTLAYQNMVCSQFTKQYLT